MKDNSVGRIDHSGHRHPDTSHWKAKCRQRVIETGKPLNQRGVDPIPPKGEWAFPEKADPLPDVPESVVPEVIDDEEKFQNFLAKASALAEAKASTALDKGDGGTYSVSTRNDEGLSLDSWAALIESLNGAHEWLSQNGELSYATIHMTVDDVKVAATFNPAVGWKVATR